MIAVSTMVSDDGVVGLNGKRYLLDENGVLMLFKSVDDAKQFIGENGEDPDNEYLDYEEQEMDNKLGIMRIEHGATPFEMVCEKCKERKGVPYFEVTDSGMAIYYCESCGKELTENNNA